MKYLQMDGITYHVRVVYESLKRRFEIVEGPNHDISISYEDIPDIHGTIYSHSMRVERDPAYPEDYDLFYDAISDPKVPYHTITVPHGQGTMTYEAKIRSGEDTYQGTQGGRKKYGGLTLNFSPRAPQRES